MGNRPQGFKALYMIAMGLFAIVMGIMLGISLLASYQGLSQKMFTISASSKESNFALLLLALVTTYGVYFGASFMYREPWHMFTSFMQYLMLLPSYTNILMVYAFCNTHDVSWGTKGDNTSDNKDLGVVTVKQGKDGTQLAEVTVPDHSQTEKNGLSVWEETKLSLQERPEKQHVPRDAKTKRDDYYRQFRSLFVLSWLLSNGLLIVVTSSQDFLRMFKIGNGAFNPYLFFVVIFVAAMSIIRGLGSIWFLVDEVLREIGIRLAGLKKPGPKKQKGTGFLDATN
jgi:chitin synthase